MAMSKSRPFTVLVEGNIGCGKTTFLQHFAKVGSGAGGWELDRQKTQECRIASVGLLMLNSRQQTQKTKYI